MRGPARASGSASRRSSSPPAPTPWRWRRCFSGSDRATSSSSRRSPSSPPPTPSRSGVRAPCSPTWTGTATSCPTRWTGCARRGPAPSCPCTTRDIPRTWTRSSRPAATCPSWRTRPRRSGRPSTGGRSGPSALLGAFSFHETKNVGCGEGGALTIRDEAAPRPRPRAPRQGDEPAEVPQGLADKYTWVDTGSSWVLSDLERRLPRRAARGARRHPGPAGRSTTATWPSFARWSSGRAGTSSRATPQQAQPPHLRHRLPRAGAALPLHRAHAGTGSSTPFHYVPLHQSPMGRASARTGRLPGSERLGAASSACRSSTTSPTTTRVGSSTGPWSSSMASEGMLSVVIPVYRSERLPGAHRPGTGGRAGAGDAVRDRPGQRWLARRRAGGHRPTLREGRRVRSVTPGQNLGQHRATLLGFSRMRGDVVVTVDDDGQNPPEAALAVARDSGARSRRRVRAVRGRRAVAVPARGLGREQLALRADHPEPLRASRSPTCARSGGTWRGRSGTVESPYPYIDAMIFRMASRIGNVPVPHRPRDDGGSSYSLGKLLSLWISHLTSLS